MFVLVLVCSGTSCYIAVAGKIKKRTVLNCQHLKLQYASICHLFISTAPYRPLYAPQLQYNAHHICFYFICLSSSSIRSATGSSLFLLVLSPFSICLYTLIVFFTYSFYLLVYLWLPLVGVELRVRMLGYICVCVCWYVHVFYLCVVAAFLIFLLHTSFW